MHQNAAEVVAVDMNRAAQHDMQHDWRRQRGRLSNSEKVAEQLAQAVAQGDKGAIELAELLTLDFRGIQPSTGGRKTDVIPNGVYPVRIDKADVTQTAGPEKNKPMITIWCTVVGTAEDGARLRDNYVLPRTGMEDNTFGIENLCALFVALGQVVTDKVIKAFDADKLVGKMFMATVQQDVIKARTAGGNDTPVSNIVGYAPYDVAATEVRGRAGGAAAAAPAPTPIRKAKPAPAPVEVEEPEDEPEEEPEDELEFVDGGDEPEDEVEEAPAPAPVPARRRAAAASPAAAAVATEVNALF